MPMNRRQLLSALAGAATLGGLGLDGEAAKTTGTQASGSQAAGSKIVLPAQYGFKSLMSTKAKDVRFRMALLTDPHVALRDRSMDFKVLRYSSWIVQQHFLTLRGLQSLTGRKVDLLLVAGDLTRDSEPWNHKAMQGWLKQQPFPSLVVPGNHDVKKKWMKPNHWGIPQFVAGYKGRYGGYQSKLPYYAHEVTPGLVIIGLNSSDTPDGSLRNTWNGKLDGAQLKWLEKTLKALAGKKLVFVMVHHNLLAHHPANNENSKSEWKNFHIDNADAALKLMGRYGVPLALTGHHHINRITRHGSLPITELTTAGACSYPASMRILDLSKDGRSLKVHTLGQPWAALQARIASAARKDKWWKLPDKPKDRVALLRFTAGRTSDRVASLSLPKRRDLK